MLNSQDALALLHEAEVLNPGPWVAHSLHVAEAARHIALRHPKLDSEKAFVFGCLHDIGRRNGISHMRHVVDGFQFLSRLGHKEEARICLSHSFPLKDVNAVFGRWDCAEEERLIVADFLRNVQYDDYDRLIQLCDALALPEGFCLLEKRFIDVALRYGTNDLTVPKWKATFEIKADFERLLGCSVYSLLSGVVETTFDLPAPSKTGERFMRPACQ